MLFYVPMLFFLGKKRLHYFPESFITSYFVNVKGFKLSLSFFFIQITAKILQFLSRALNCLESWFFNICFHIWTCVLQFSFRIQLCIGCGLVLHIPLLKAHFCLGHQAIYSQKLLANYFSAIVVTVKSMRYRTFISLKVVRWKHFARI